MNSNGSENLWTLFKDCFPSVSWAWFLKFLFLGICLALFFVNIVEDWQGSDTLVMNWPVFRGCLGLWFLLAAPAYHIGRQLEKAGSEREGYGKALAEWAKFSPEQQKYLQSLVCEIHSLDLLPPADKGMGKLEKMELSLKQLSSDVTSTVYFPPIVHEVLREMLEKEKRYLYSARKRWALLKNSDEGGLLKEDV